MLRQQKLKKVQPGTCIVTVDLLTFIKILNLTISAYFKLALQYHPDKADKTKFPDAEEMFKKISDVYQVLSDPVLRKKYNEFGPGKSGKCNVQYKHDDFINRCDFVI